MSPWARTHEKYFSPKRQEQIVSILEELGSRGNYEAQDFVDEIVDKFNVSFYSDLVATRQNITDEEWKAVLKELYKFLNKKYKELFTN